MAGKDIVKSSKSTFMNASPSAKQASILSFFGTQKTQAKNAIPVSDANETEKLPFTESADASEDNIENVFPDMFNEPLEFTESKSKKACISGKEINFVTKKIGDTGVLTPKILSDLNDAAGNDIDNSDVSCGRYQWLIDLKDINGRRKGNNRHFLFLMSIYFRR